MNRVPVLGLGVIPDNLGIPNLELLCGKGMKFTMPCNLPRAQD